MDTNSIKQSLLSMIKGLNYSSESDYPLTLLDWGKPGGEQEIKRSVLLHKGVQEPVFPMKAADFFNNHISRLRHSGDEQMMADAEKYKKLFDFLQANAASVDTWRCGKIEVGVYIIIHTKDDHVLVLQTTSVET